MHESVRLLDEGSCACLLKHGWQRHSKDSDTAHKNVLCVVAALVVCTPRLKQEPQASQVFQPPARVRFALHNTSSYK
jgi:hypothetical protein